MDSTLFWACEYEPGRERRVVRELLSWSPMGIILTGLYHDETISGMIAQLDIPVVQIMDVEENPGSKCWHVHTAAAIAADYLFDKGYRRFGYIGAWGERPSRSRARRLAFQVNCGTWRNTFRRLDLTERSSALGGSKATSELYAKHPDIDCIFYANDDLALVDFSCDVSRN